MRKHFASNPRLFLGTHDFLPTTHDFLPTTHDFLPTTHDILPTTHDILPTTHDPRLLASPKHNEVDDQLIKAAQTSIGVVCKP